MNINILGSNCSYNQGTIQGDGWSTLITGLESSGVKLFFNDISLKTYDLIISFDHYRWMEDIFSKLYVPINRRILIIQEPEVVLPRMYKDSVLSLYGKVFAASSDWAERLGAKYFEYPLDISSATFLDISERTVDTAMIQSNKFSCVKGEQYSLRRAILRLAKKKNYKIELYGTGWNRRYIADFVTVSKYLRVILRDVQLNNFTLPYKYLGSIYPNYKGKIENKIDLLGNVKKNIVIENSSTYVSEKLIDSIRSGCVPFYVGPNLTKYGIPNSVAVLCEASPKGILDRLTSITNEKLTEIQAEGNDFLNSREIRNWSAPVQVNKLLQCINALK